MAKKDDAIATRPESSLTAPVPEYLKKYAGDHRGTDHMTKEDLRMPRLALAQKMSPELEASDPKFIEGLKFGELFNNLSREIYGPGPLFFTVVRADRPRGIEFNPIEEGGGVKDFNVPLNDPRMQFTTDEQGRRVKPIATKFYDYILLLVPSREMIALSLKGTGLKVATSLNALMKIRNQPCFNGLYELTTGTERNSQGQTYAVYRVRNAGWVDEETGAFAEQIFEEIKDRKFEIDREAGSEAATDAEVVGEDGKPVPF